MPTSVVMPALEMAQETGTVVRWLKREGEYVAKGDMLIEIETDKAVLEIEAQTDGVLAGLTASEGDVIPVGQTIAWLVQPGEDIPDQQRVAPIQTARRTDSVTATAPVGVIAPAISSVSHRPRISPKARKLAADLSVDLAAVQGSGPGGEILADDVRAAAHHASVNASTTASETVAVSLEPLSSIGRLMAERTTASWTTVPHFFVSREVDATALKGARERLLPLVERSHHVKVTHTDLLVASVARALRAHPRVNASWSAEGIQLHADVNVGVAMAVDNAVVTGIIKQADRVTIGEIAARRLALTERARAGRLQPADISGATFTISNLGMFGVEAFTAIIVPPQAGILAIGAIVDRIVVVDGQPAVRPQMTITLSSDHRVVDGARAASFLATVVDGLQHLDDVS